VLSGLIPARRVSCKANVDGKLWIQRYGTEEGIGNDPLSAGIPRDRIVLGFRPAEVRQLPNRPLCDSQEIAANAKTEVAVRFFRQPTSVLL
jgi:hypothetical protein